MNIYAIFQEKANKVKYDLLEFLLQSKKENKKLLLMEQQQKEILYLIMRE